MKTNSGHDPKILRGIFTGFLHRAYTNCKPTQREEEITFLIQCFTENGYNERQLRKIAELPTKNDNTNLGRSYTIDTNDNAIVTLPWIPGLSPKLRKSFKKVDYKTIFKSNANLKTILT